MPVKYIKAEEGSGLSVKYFDDKGKIWQFLYKRSRKFQPSFLKSIQKK